MPAGDQNKQCTTQVICEYCRRTLEAWLRGEKRALRFATPRIWREPSNHHLGCYFCMVDPSKRREGKSASPIEYPNIPSSIASVPYNTSDLPKSNPPTKVQQMVAVKSSEDSEMEEGEPSSSVGVRRRQRSCPYYPNQEDINNLIREMVLTKSIAELFVSRLKRWDLLDNGVQITSQRKRHCEFSRFFS